MLRAASVKKSGKREQNLQIRENNGRSLKSLEEWLLSSPLRPSCFTIVEIPPLSPFQGEVRLRDLRVLQQSFSMQSGGRSRERQGGGDSYHLLLFRRTIKRERFFSSSSPSRIPLLFFFRESILKVLKEAL